MREKMEMEQGVSAVCKLQLMADKHEVWKIVEDIAESSLFPDQYFPSSLCLFNTFDFNFQFAVSRMNTKSSWPSDGGAATTVDNAGTYNSNSIKHAKRATPKKPGSVGNEGSMTG